MRYITHSETAVARRCWRKWYITHYRQLYRKAERINENNLIGDLVHDSLAEWYAQGQDSLAHLTLLSETLLEDQRDLIVEGVGDEARIIIEENIATIASGRDFARIIIEGYLQWVAEEGADQHLRFISAEEEVTVRFPLESLPTEVSLLAKLDARFHDLRLNSRVFMDHKTVDQFGDKERMAHLDPQFYFYSLVDYLRLSIENEERGTGAKDPEQIPWTSGGVLNMLRRVKRTARATPPFYKRKEVQHSIVELTNYFKRLSGEITDILQKEAALDAGVDHHIVCPPNPTRDCLWDCAYMSLCAFMDDGSDSEGYIEASFDIRSAIQRYTTVEGLRS